MKNNDTLKVVLAMATSQAMWMDFYKRSYLVKAHKPRFRVGERIQPLLGQVFAYEVLKTPDTCNHNNQPAYLIKSLSPIETPPFHRYQMEIDLAWHSMDAILFPVGSYIRHKKSGGVYQVKITPADGRLEGNNIPAYSYKDVKGGPVWHRSQTETEDGRFELVPTGEHFGG